MELGNPARRRQPAGQPAEAGAQDQVARLLARDQAERAAKHAAATDPAGVASLDSPREAREQEQATALAERARRTLDDPGRLARLLDSLLEAGEQDQVTTLLAADPAAHLTLGGPRRATSLLDSLRETGEQDQVTALVERAAHTTRGSIWGFFRSVGIRRLLDSLRKAGAQNQVTALANRLPGEGLFRLFRSQGNHRALYRFGRNPDGSPAKPWGWEDLD